MKIKGNIFKDVNNVANETYILYNFAYQWVIHILSGNM